MPNNSSSHIDICTSCSSTFMYVDVETKLPGTLCPECRLRSSLTEADSQFLIYAHTIASFAAHYGIRPRDVEDELNLITDGNYRIIHD